MESMLMNYRHINLYNSQDKDLIKKVNLYGCFMERCNHMIEFLLLTEHDFDRESTLKQNMFRKLFENHNCPEFMKFFSECNCPQSNFQ